MDKLENISAQWDFIARERFETLKNKEDLTYENILIPLFLSHAKNNKGGDFLDVGCGLGFLTKKIAEFSHSTVGIDISKLSLDLAIEYNGANNIIYVNGNVENFCPEKTYDLITANMVLMDMPKINKALEKIYTLLNPGGTFVYTITHPAFWPIYWDYYDENNFDYNKETEITTDFKISGKIYNDFKTSHFHRPMSDYLNLAHSTGFKISIINELPEKNPNTWYPRFLSVELKKM